MLDEPGEGVLLKTSVQIFEFGKLLGALGALHVPHYLLQHIRTATDADHRRLRLLSLGIIVRVASLPVILGLINIEPLRCYAPFCMQ